jgi:hypothetical protein
MAEEHERTIALLHIMHADPVGMGVTVAEFGCHVSATSKGIAAILGVDESLCRDTSTNLGAYTPKIKKNYAYVMLGTGGIAIRRGSSSSPKSIPLA